MTENPFVTALQPSNKLFYIHALSQLNLCTNFFCKYMCSNRTFIILGLSIFCYGIFSSLMTRSRSLKCVQLESTAGEPGPQHLRMFLNIECLNLLRAHASCALKYHSLCLLNIYIISAAMIGQRTFREFYCWATIIAEAHRQPVIQ